MKQERVVSLAGANADVRRRSPLLVYGDRLALVALLAFVAVAPFPYGAILPGGNLMIELFAFLSAALALIFRPADRLIGAAAVPIVALIAIAFIGIVQIVPLSPSTIEAVSPVSARTWADASEILELFNRPRLSPRISIAPNETLSTILLTLAYAALFASAAVLLRTRYRRRLLLVFLFASTVGHILYAAIAGVAADRVHGAFVNPNHFAGYLEIALAAAFGTLWAEVLVNRGRAEGIRDRADRLEKRMLPLAGRILLWGVVAAGIALTRSRGGILAAVLTTLILLVMAVVHRVGEHRRRRLALTSASALLLGFAFVAFTMGQWPLLRFLSSDPRDIGSDDRVMIWKTSIDAWHLFPHLGSGLGAFREAFRRVQPGNLHGLAEQAHNDFLQLLVTGGWIGAILGVVAFVSVGVLLLRGWRRQLHREESAFILGGFGALLSLTLHGLVEFNMSLPAIPATLAVLAGGACAAMRSPHAEEVTSPLDRR